jgi:hypothetical protein
MFDRSLRINALLLLLMLVAFATSCARFEERQAAKWADIPAPDQPSITNALTVPLVFPESYSDDGIQKEEALAASWIYFHKFLGTCGMTEEPQDASEYWRSELIVGYIGHQWGWLWIRKDGGSVFLQPRQKPSPRTVQRLQYYGLNVPK